MNSVQTTSNAEKTGPVSPADISEELTSLVRGLFAAPVISALSRLAVFENLLLNPDFKPQNFSPVQDKKLLEDSLRYLARIGLVTVNEEKGSWALTELGKQIFQRASSFYVPHSYQDYMARFYERLLGQEQRKPSVDRAENVIGSGRTHLRYFPFATSLLKRRAQFDVAVDIGCGDGKFLGAVLKSIPGKSAVGIDNSTVSVQMTQENLRREHPESTVNILCADAFRVEDWSGKVRQIAGGKGLILSMWFLLHEISEKKPERVLDFLRRVHASFPEACVVIGEIVRHEIPVLAKGRKHSLMPEYLFFHDMSGQGVLSWKEYNEILKASPYGIHTERLFDEIPDAAGVPVPSSFVWYLVPQKEN